MSWAAFLLCFTLLILSNSKTGLISFLFMLPLFALHKINKQKSYSLKMVLLHIGFLLIGGGTIIAASAYEPILDSLGKEMTLTGRIPFWTLLWEKFLQRPFLGYGYNAFWEGPDGKEIESILTWAGHAHNGFYEVALATGVMGLSLLLINFFRNYGRAISYAKSSSNLKDLWPAQIFTMLFFVNMTVGTTFLAIDFVWLFYVAIDLSLANHSYEQHQVQQLDRRRSREELLFSYLDQ
ncbi:MAG: O-antigen ligase family protein [Synechococcaceae cyanobacterium RL_1_2]|nr:O-antigen ligase family protein [Synechococcaceae cyanobacterium RL_1_2]